ncbi:MAG: hypothetical protein NZ611_05150 [Bacteroidia bacterium]|nr:hypothetical protein [Bacteroidia bacterium]
MSGDGDSTSIWRGVLRLQANEKGGIRSFDPSDAISNVGGEIASLWDKET